jgi:hypothetical protein
MMDNEIKIAVLEDQFEAQLLSSILTERDIPHSLRSYHDTAYDGLFQVSKGWGAIYSPESYKTEITEILNEIRTKQLNMDGETDLDME